jgi:hypothetical protein
LIDENYVDDSPKIEYEPLPVSFNGIEGLKPRGTTIEYTKEMLSEWYKCYQDPLYFISNYYYIVTLDNGLEKIKLWDFQVDFIRHLHDNRFSIILASRQVGKSIITIGYILWYILFRNHKEIAVLSKTANAASEIMGKLQRAYIQVPQWLSQNIVGWAGTSISLENGCHVSSQATTENAGRSASANILFLDEFAFVPTNIANKFYRSAYPVISNSKTSKVIICSTPNGHNHFYILYDKAEKNENFFKVYKIYWDQVPGRDEVWKQMTIANLDLEGKGGGEAAFAQEYELKFENASSKTLISASAQRFIADFISRNSVELSIDKLVDDLPGLKIYEKPQRTESFNLNYFLSADVGAGVGGDFSSFVIIKVENKQYKHVATYNNNMIIPIAFAEVINKVSKYYNNAQILVENNGPGGSCADYLWYTLESDNMINLDKNANGCKTTKPLRDKGITKLKEYLEYHVMELNDIEILQQIEKFVLNQKNGKFEAEKGYHDDLVMCLIQFCYFTMDSSFESYLNYESNISSMIKERVVEDNPYLIDYDKIMGQSGAVTIVSNDMLGTFK